MSKEQEFYDALRAIVVKYHAMPDLAPLSRLITIGQRIAQRHISGQTGAGMDKDAQLYLDLMSDLPDELKVLL